ncbi:hypothetical protein K440DRAFT_661049 [Wilcoxina mikolae CBS 423.85]|nr:hypothetical protein K440DRAFT_661049 [Wilcoxina mikolae CBS 423.85]
MPPLSRTPSRKSASLLRRANTVSSSAPTKSEMLGPNEKKQQAVVAARRAFGDEADRRIRGSQSSAEMRPRLSEMNLNKLHLNRQSSVKCQPTRQLAVAESTADSYQHSGDYGYSRASSTVHDDPRHYGFDDDSTDPGDYASTIVRRRKSMQWHMEHMTPVRGRQNFATAELDTSFGSRDYSPPHLGSSTPSSYRRIRKAKSAFVVSPIFPPSNQDISSVVYAAERSPQKNAAEISSQKDNSRKSMSFLRGGTEFMGEGRSRERRSYYMESSQRRGCPPIVPEVTGKYKGKNAKGEWGAMRFSVKKKARKISESVFGSMRKVLGISCNDNKGSLRSIPEQHVPSKRMHFRDYVTPEEVHGEQVFAAPGKFGEVKEKPKIRSNYVISKPPSLHLVPSHEMIRSDVGSIRDATPPIAFQNRKFSATSMGSISTATWNSTIASRITSRTLRDNSADKGRMSPVLDGDESEYFRPPPKRERCNVDARRVYSALVKRFNQEADKETIVPSQEPGYYMTPGIGLLPEEEGIFERHSTSQLGGTGVKREDSNVTIKLEPQPECYEREPESPPPPIPKIPKIWLENEVAKTSAEGSTEDPRLSKSYIPSDEPDSAMRSRTAHECPSTKAASTAQTRLAISKKGPSTDSIDSSNMAQLIGGEGNLSVNTFATSTDAALSACHLQMLEKRRLTPRSYASNENLHRGPAKRFSHLEAGEGIRRARSVLDCYNSNTQVPAERTKIAMGYERPLSQNILARSGLRSIDTNTQVAPVVGSNETPFVITKRASRTSLSGRVRG